uniref:Leishmanolysin-like peptidase n=2 Tax=Schistosoma japonicum TaxID=6182 RepID=C1LEW5_SCHJA|nr:Peptidase M8, leishmanolysin,domain-containing protein [Schistosoma japonicum]
MQTSPYENIPYCRRDQCSNEQSCYNLTIPDDYLSACYQRKYAINTPIYSEGVGLAQNELLIIVSNKYVKCGERTVAWATFCERDPDTGRPFIGEINYCLFGDELLKADDQGLLEITKHEIGHILGFHSTVYYALPDLDLGFRLSQNNSRPVQDITLRWLSAKGTFNISKTIIRLPNMLEEARNHFKCNELQGIELIDSHFSHRIMGNELMTPWKSAIQHVSRITLAYFKDTGMYDVNYSMANRFTYGKGLGCDFVMKSCYEYIRNRQLKGRDIKPFCNKPDEIKCLNSERAFGRCLIYKTDNELPLENQYMDSLFNVPSNETQYTRGPPAYDYCPIIETYRLEENRTSSCTSNISLKRDLTTNLFLEDLGRNSTCFEHTRMKYVNYSPTRSDSRTASCHKFDCSEGFLWIIINEERYKCPIKGGVIEIAVELENASVFTNMTCPKCKEICEKKKCQSLG